MGSDLLPSACEELNAVVYQVGQVHSWDEPDRIAVLHKLRAIGVTDVDKFRTMVYSSEINSAFRQLGFKTLNNDTFITLRSALDTNTTHSEELYAPENTPPASFSPPSSLPDTSSGESTSTECGSPQYTCEGVVESDEEDNAGRGHEEESEVQDNRHSLANVVLPDYLRLPVIDKPAVWHVVDIPLSMLFFYQTTVTKAFSCGKLLQFTIDQLRSGERSPTSLPLMHVVVMRGKLYSMGTRRLTCFHHVWGRSDPDKLIPVLMCGKRCAGNQANHEGTKMQLFSSAKLDGVQCSSVVRTLPLKMTTVAQLMEKYNRNVLPIEHNGNFMHPLFQD